MIPEIGMPQGVEWLMILLVYGFLIGVVVLLIVLVRRNRRPTTVVNVQAGSAPVDDDDLAAIREMLAVHFGDDSRIEGAAREIAQRFVEVRAAAWDQGYTRGRHQPTTPNPWKQHG